MAGNFPFVEVKQKARKLDLQAIVKEIEMGLATASSGEMVDNEYIRAYSLDQTVIQTNSGEPWNLAAPEVSTLKKRILSVSNCDRLDSVFEMTQGVTPGGGCLDIFLLDSAESVEAALMSPAVEAEDIADWRIGLPRKWLLYPYAADGRLINLGKLDYDLEQADAQKRIDALIATGSIKYPRASRYLVRSYDRLVAREAEKKTWDDYGKEWYEYHRPRDPAVMKSSPKILTRRMTHDMEFALDDRGSVPTDGCIALTFKKNNRWLKQALEQGLTNNEAFLFCVAVLNSSLMKLVLKSSSDACQGNFLQVREDSIGLFPIKILAKGVMKNVRHIVSLTNGALADSEKRKDVDKAVIQLYGLKSDSDSIVSHSVNS